MTFLEKTKQTGFWKNVLKVAVPFFIIVVLFSLIYNSWSAIIAGNFNEVTEINFNDGKWKIFFGSKIIVSLIYGIYITSKNTK